MEHYQQSLSTLAKRQALTLQHLKTRWRHKYLARVPLDDHWLWHNQRVCVGDVVLVQDEGPQINRRLSVKKG